MAKGKDVLKALVRLADRGKLSDETINGLLDGMIVNDVHVYRGGNLVGKDGAVRTLSPDRITSVDWAKPRV